jgi:hypothetical protein
MMITADIAAPESVGVYNNAGTWALWNTTTDSADIVGFGWADTMPIVGDWNGDGVTDVGIYNNAGNNFLLKTNSSYDVIGLGWTGTTPVVGIWNSDHAWLGSVAYYLMLLETDFDDISVAMANNNYARLSTVGQKIIEHTQKAFEDNSQYIVSPMFQEAQSEWSLALADFENVGKYTITLANDLKNNHDSYENVAVWLTYLDSAIHHMNRAAELVSNN